MAPEETPIPTPRQLPDTAANLYAESLEQLLAEEAAGLPHRLHGAFKQRTVAGRRYWYYQYRDLDQRVRQIYCGPVGGPWDRVAERQDHDGVGDPAMDHEQQAGLLRAAGLPVVPAGPFRLLAALTDAGVFRAGGILVGTYAFMALGNQLGYVWSGRAATTQDVDIAHSRAVELAVPGAELKLPDVLDALQMGYRPIPRLDPRQPSTSFMFRNQQLRLDLLTPGHGARTRPIPIQALGAAAQPLKFLEYLLVGPQPAILVGARVVRVAVPDPARFAVHKLIISSDRPASETAKSRKDDQQAAQLFTALLENRPGDILPAWKKAAEQGPGWRRRLRTGLARLPASVADALRARGIETEWG